MIVIIKVRWFLHEKIDIDVIKLSNLFSGSGHSGFGG